MRASRPRAGRKRRPSQISRRACSWRRPDITGANSALGKLPSNLSAEEKRACEQPAFVWKHVAYGLMMATRPQTLTGLADSPVGLAAFLLDHDAASLELISRVFAGQSEGLTRDDVLDNITLFWLTNTGVSASRLYAENKLSFFAAKGVSPSVPVAVSVFPDELYRARRAGQSRRIPISSTTTRSTRAGTSRPGNSHNSFQQRFAPGSGRFARSPCSNVSTCPRSAGPSGSTPSHSAPPNCSATLLRHSERHKVPVGGHLVTTWR